ncbi:MAG: chondroitinase, partial [Bacteroidetes bacterium]|nr:chondroitinase [Bacteroidota bacterium]
YANDSGTLITKEWGIPGTTSFTGGVSDSLYGVSVYDMNYDSVQAKKAWFFFDREVLCLGAGISSKAPENLTTTVNQCWLNGEVIKSGGTADNLAWVLHDSIGYFFPQGGHVNISTQTQSGSWYRINNFQQKDIVSGKVFTCWLDHGAQPQQAGYAYIVVPGIAGRKAMEDYRPEMRICQNTDTLQAVEHTGLGLLQIVFYKAGRLNTGTLSVSADQPCVLSIKNVHGAKPVLYIADPAGVQRQIAVSLQWSATGKTSRVLCTLPQGAYAGATAAFNIDNQ